MWCLSLHHAMGGVYVRCSPRLRLTRPRPPAASRQGESPIVDHRRKVCMSDGATGRLPAFLIKPLPWASGVEGRNSWQRTALERTVWKPLTHYSPCVHWSYAQVRRPNNDALQGHPALL